MAPACSDFWRCSLSHASWFSFLPKMVRMHCHFPWPFHPRGHRRTIPMFAPGCAWMRARVQAAPMKMTGTSPPPPPQVSDQTSQKCASRSFVRSLMTAESSARGAPKSFTWWRGYATRRDATRLYATRRYTTIRYATLRDATPWHEATRRRVHNACACTRTRTCTLALSIALTLALTRTHVQSRRSKRYGISL